MLTSKDANLMIIPKAFFLSFTNMVLKMQYIERIVITKSVNLNICKTILFYTTTILISLHITIIILFYTLPGTPAAPQR